MKNSPKTLFQYWLNHPSLIEEERNTLDAYSQEIIEDAFFKDIEFGTAGMRGVMGLGTNRINRFTIKKATIAYGLMLLNLFPDHLDAGVVIAHDNRQQAIPFTKLVSETLNTMGISTYIFSELVPTPLLSFAVRELKALGGIMLTASHNPKEYNGFKVYDNQGCQLVPLKIQPLFDQLNRLPEPLSVQVPMGNRAGMVNVVSHEIEKLYLSKVAHLQMNPNLPKDNFPIIFSPQHGASYRIIPQFFKHLGYQLHVVPSQANPDPLFSGTQSPNPEDPKAYHEAIELARHHQAPLVMVADPDADRVGIAFRNQEGEYTLLNGNESAALLIHYLLTQRTQHQPGPVQGVMYDTIVSSPLARQIAKSFGLKTETFLTGFKFIGERIAFYQAHAGPSFIFGYEESYGCLVGDFVRDKDAIQALTLYAEMTLYHHRQGKTLGDALSGLFSQYGYYVDRQFSLTLSGKEGAIFLDQLLSQLRKTPFKPLNTFKVIRFDDYFKQERKDQEGHTSAIALPQANVVQFTFDDESSIIVRPSGTEPKCKFYFSIKSENQELAESKLDKLVEAFSHVYLTEDKRLK